MRQRATAQATGPWQRAVLQSGSSGGSNMNPYRYLDRAICRRTQQGDALKGDAIDAGVALWMGLFHRCDVKDLREQFCMLVEWCAVRWPSRATKVRAAYHTFLNCQPDEAKTRLGELNHAMLWL